jgi:hypothetical protein
VGWLAKLLGATPREELSGIRLDMSKPFWELDGRTDFPLLLRALGELLPEGCILYFEDGSKALADFFHAHAIPERCHIAVGTMWPRPIYFHVPATPENLSDLIELAKSHAEPELAIHFHVYRDGEVLLQWYDAFAGPMFLSGTLLERDIRAFAEALGMTATLRSS